MTTQQAQDTLIADLRVRVAALEAQVHELRFGLEDLNGTALQTLDGENLSGIQA